MSGTLDLSPWARQAIPDQAALRRRVPDGHTLTVVTRDHRHFTVYLTTPRGRVAESSGLPIEQALEAVVPVSYLRCATCGKRLGDYGDCDSCTFDESEARRAR
jgi:hypothetical protein